MAEYGHACTTHETHLAVGIQGLNSQWVYSLNCGLCSKPTNHNLGPNPTDHNLVPNPTHYGLHSKPTVGDQAFL